MSVERVEGFLNVWIKDGSIVRCRISDEPALASAMDSYLGGESWKETADRDDRDQLVRLTHVSGSRIRLLTSAISGWMVSTREDRQRDTQFDVAIEREKEAFAAAANPENSGNSAAPC